MKTVKEINELIENKLKECDKLFISLINKNNHNEYDSELMFNEGISSGLKWLKEEIND